MTNEEKMRVAIGVAEESLKNGELPVGAVIFGVMILWQRLVLPERTALNTCAMRR